MREIELKFKVDDVDKLINKLESLGCSLSEPITQNDTIYVSDLNHVESVAGSIWLRVRKKNDEVELNLKKQSERKSESQEIEFTVSSYEKARAFLECLGYQKWVEVNKVRRTSKYQSINICIDKVERLGSFVELEYLIPEDDSKKYEDELLSIAKELEIDTTKIINSHYDTMISELGA